MDYTLNAGVLSGIFAVPNSVVDNFIKLANEANVKVLLFVLRNNGQNLSSSTIAAALNITENQVEEAMVFWEAANIFQKNTGITQTAPIATTVPEISKINPVSKPKQEETVIVKKTVAQERRDYNINPSEIAERIQKSEDIKFLFAMSEQTFARPLNHTEQRSLIWIHDYLGLSAEVILMLTTFCITSDKGNIKYIEKVAGDWHDRGINTLELAQAEVNKLEKSHKYNNRIMKIFCMERKPIKKEQTFIDSWIEKGYSLELIEYAYEKTIESINKLSFPYINTILENWYKDGLTTKAQVDSIQKQPQLDNQKKEYSFDLNEYKSLVNNFGDE